MRTIYVDDDDDRAELYEVRLKGAGVNQPIESRHGLLFEITKHTIMKPDPRILFIEDDLKDVELVMIQLKMANFDPHVKVITDGRLAVNYLTSKNAECESLAVVFLDLKLPFISGISVLEKIRADERIRHLPVIVMTSSNSPEDLEKCTELGVAHFLPKPITFPAFAKAIADCIHNPPVVAPMEIGSSMDD